MLTIKVHERVNETNLSGFKQMFQKFMGGADNCSYTNGNWKIATGAYDLWFEIYLNGTPIIGCVDGKCKWYKNPMEVGLSKEDGPKIEAIITSEYPEISFVGKNESVCESFNPRTVQIGDEIWMSRNLTIDDGGDGIYRTNGQTYYTWEAAMRVANSIPGWHLPTATDINTLIADAGGDTSGTALKSTTGWQRNGNGTDEFGFAAYPVGYVIGSSLQEDGYNASFWSSTENDNKWADTLMMCSQNKSARLYFGDKKYARPVRLVKD